MIGQGHSGKQRALLYESTGKPVCMNLVEFIGGVHYLEENKNLKIQFSKMRI
jgi:hypothetical protein